MNFNFVGEKNYLCAICEKSFSNPSSLRVHQLSHAEDKAYQCKVSSCDKSFASASALR